MACGAWAAGRQLYSGVAVSSVLGYVPSQTERVALVAGGSGALFKYRRDRHQPFDQRSR